MKFKLTILMFVVMVGFSSIAQQVEREIVIVEIATGTWCGYCPAAANGADDLIENGKDVGIIEYHNGDNYVSPESNSRISYYNVGGFPTAIFDGVSEISGGGGASESMYSYYLPRYNNRISIPTSYEINLVGSNIGMEVFNIEVTCNKVAESDASNLKLHVVLTETHIPENWGGLQQLDFVQRRMYPNQNGTALDFSSSDELTFNYTITPDESWNIDNCELVIFIQDGSKEIHQGKKIKLSELTGTNDYDVSLKSIKNVSEKQCNGTINPIVEVVNFGIETITSFEVSYNVNNGNLEKFNWTGNLSAGEEVLIELPEIMFDVLDENTLEVELLNPNDQLDEYIDNNIKQYNFVKADTTTRALKLMLRTDNHPEELSWDIKNSAGEVIYSGGPYEDALTFVEANVDLQLSDIDCYSFTIYDSGNNGFADGSGVVKLRSDDNVTIMEMMNEDFGSKKEMQFTTKYGISTNDIENNSEISIYPNPTIGAFSVDVTLDGVSDIDVTVFDIVGKIVFCTGRINGNIGENHITIPADDFNSGLYMVQVMIDGTEQNHRVIVK